MKKIEGHCNPVYLQFTQEGKQVKSGGKGLMWGIWLHGGLLETSDLGTIFMVWLVQQTLQTAIDPNQVINPLGPQPWHPGRGPYTMQTLGARSNIHIPIVTRSPWTGSVQTEEEDPLLTLLNQSFLVLNTTKSDRTASCWLCYDAAALPCYEGIVIKGTYSQVSDFT